MNCPRCNVALVMSERQGIEIDYCPNCRGVWLDRGELEKIIERSVMPQGQTVFAPSHDMHNNHEYRHHDNKHHDYYKHRKKGWFGELFD